MKKYCKELIITLIEILTLYLCPLISRMSDPIGMVLLMLLITLILSIILGSISKERVKYLFPIVIGLLFIPSVFIYYNESALIHSVWYFVTSLIGICIGNVIKTGAHSS